MDDLSDRYHSLGLEPAEGDLALTELLRSALLAQADLLAAADVERFPHEPVDPSRAPEPDRTAAS